MVCGLSYHDVFVGFPLLSGLLLGSLSHVLAILVHSYKSFTHHGHKVLLGDWLVSLSVWLNSTPTMSLERRGGGERERERES